MEKFIELVQSPDKDLHPAVMTLCRNLKIFGAQLESNFKGVGADICIIQIPSNNVVHIYLPNL